MTISFNRTRNQIAQRVLGKVLKIGAVSAASADVDTVVEALDLRLKEIHKLGIFWRKVASVPTTFSLTASVATASAGAGEILFPIRVTFTNGTNDDPVTIIGKDEYAQIIDKEVRGLPEKVLWKGGTEFIFWPVPATNGTAKLLYESIADDTSAGAVIDIDQSMIRPMMDLVKYDVADDFGVPEGTIQRWMLEAKKAELDIRKLSVQRVNYTPVAVDDFDNRRMPYT